MARPAAASPARPPWRSRRRIRTWPTELPHFPLPAQIWGNSPTHGYKLLLNSALDVTENSKVYLFANYMDSHADQSFNFRSSLVGTRDFVDEDGNFVAPRRA